MYNIYSKQTGMPQRLDALELNAKDDEAVDAEMEAAEPEQQESSEQLFTRLAPRKTQRL